MDWLFWNETRAKSLFHHLLRKIFVSYLISPFSLGFCGFSVECNICWGLHSPSLTTEPPQREPHWTGAKIALGRRLLFEAIDMKLRPCKAELSMTTTWRWETILRILCAKKSILSKDSVHLLVRRDSSNKKQILSFGQGRAMIDEWKGWIQMQIFIPVGNLWYASDRVREWFDWLTLTDWRVGVLISDLQDLERNSFWGASLAYLVYVFLGMRAKKLLRSCRLQISMTTVT